MKPIVVIGSINMDLVIGTDKMPVMGETVLGSGFMNTPGGKGANQAVAAARLGGDVTMLGCVGDDVFGGAMRENLTRNGINTATVHTVEGTPSGVAIIVIKDGDNAIIVDPGANGCVTPAMVEELEQTIAGCGIVVMQLEIPLETVEAAARIATKHGVRVILNPAPACALPDALLAQVDIITPNESECALLTGMDVREIDDAKKAALSLQRKGVKRVMVTLGGRGVVYTHDEACHHIPAPRVDVVDTTAAGDAFTGALAVALSRQKPIHEAVRIASGAGACAVTKKGAQAALPGMQEALACSADI